MPLLFKGSARRFRLHRSRHIWFSPQTWRKRLVFVGGAVAVGLAAVLFARAADASQAVFRALIAERPWLPFVLAPLGLGLSAWLTVHVVPGAQGSGIPQTIAARQVGHPEARRRLLSLRTAAGKMVLTVLGLACGASIGREGPTVQVGAAVMLAAGAVAGLGRQPGLILAGAATGVAAAFNTPLAGIVFAIEELSRSFERRTGELVISAVIIGGLAAMMLAGNYTYFGQTGASLGLADWPAVLLAGLVGGLGGGMFSRMVVETAQSLAGGRLAGMGRRPMLLAFACGLLVAVFGALSGGLTYGTGYDEARALLDGQAAPDWSFAPLKLLATAVCAVSGIPGGIFSPSLSVGAGFGAILATLLPGSAAGSVILLSMAGYFAGVVQAPLTAMIIVMEMSRDPGMLLPLMLTTLFAANLSRLIAPRAIYHALAEGFLPRDRH